MWIGRKEFDALCEQVGRQGNRIYQLEQTLRKADAKRMQLMEVVKEGEQYYLHILIETSDGEPDLYYDLPVELRGCGISGCGVCTEETVLDEGEE